jgi:hypothetical protein
VALTAHDRDLQVKEVEAALRLQHLASFFERTSIRTA